MVLCRLISIVFASTIFFRVGESASVCRADLIRYFHSITGCKIIAGQHNREPNYDPKKWTRVAHKITGEFPGLWGGDFLYSHDDVEHRQFMIDEAIHQWKAGSIVALTWHACPPTTGECCNWDGGVLSKLNKNQWNSLIHDGGHLNKIWKQRLDTLCPYFQQLEDAGVVVIWRPFHEMNGNWYWWGGRPGKSGSRKLYEITYDYLSPKFKNLVWVWAVDDHEWVMDYIEDFFPRGDTVDIVALDVWMDKQPTYENYRRMLHIANGRPIALAEVGSVPSPETLERQNRWVWFMVWADFLKNSTFNSDQSVRDTYYLKRTLTQGEMKGIASGSEYACM